MQRYYFLHIRKTAGTSMTSYLADCFGRENVCPLRSQAELERQIPEADRRDYLERYTLVAGHYLTVPRSFTASRFTFTMLREPIARVLSEYRHMLRDPNDPYYPVATRCSLAEAIHTPELAMAMRNHQTRYLVTNAGEDYEQLSDAARFACARDYLAAMPFFGIAEMFESSLEMLSRQPGFARPTHYPALNRYPDDKGPRARIPSDCESALRETNAIDTELYEYGCRLFDRRCGAMHREASFDDERFVIALYRGVLGREPDTAGLTALCARVRAGLLGKAQLVNEFTSSREAKARRFGDLWKELQEGLLEGRTVIETDALGAFVRERLAVGQQG